MAGISCFILVYFSKGRGMFALTGSRSALLVLLPWPQTVAHGVGAWLPDGEE